MKLPKMKHLALVGIILTIYLVYFILQTQVDYSSDTLYDGKQYIKIVNYFSNYSTNYNVDFPFNSRIGVPYLVSLFANTITGFLIINAVSLFAFLIILSYFLTNYIKATFAQLTGVLLWVSLHFAGPLRYYIHDPMSIDLPSMVFEGLVVLSFLKQKTIFLVCAAICGIFIKESMIPLLAILIISSFLFQQKKLLKPLLLTLLLTIIIKTIIGFQFPMVISNWKYNSVITLLFKLKFIVQNPIEFFQWATSLLFVCGVFLLRFKLPKNLSSQQKTIFLIAVYGLIISLLGGEDYARLLFTSSIFIFSMLIYFIQKTDTKITLYLILGSFPFIRITAILPRNNSYLTFPEYFDVNTCLVWLGYLLLATIIHKYYQRRTEYSNDKRR
jgi:hypothetical protein